MTILTIKQRYEQSDKGKEVLKILQTQHKKSGTQFNWIKSRPSLCLKEDLIPISQLHIDTDTQRDPFSASRVDKLKRIVAKPCPKKYKRVIVSNRAWEKGSQYFIVEGQGRVLAAYAMGESSVPYDLYRFENKHEEAQFFLEQGHDVHTIKDWEKHSVILGLPHNKWYTQAKDIEKVVLKTLIEYEPQKINKVDCSKAFSGIRDSMTRCEPSSQKKKAGQRNCEITIAITNLMIKYCHVPTETLVLRSDLYYPFTEFVLSYSKTKVGIQKLEEKIKSLKNTNGGNLTLDDMAIACSLNICKNQADKRARYKNIKKW